MKLRLNDVLDRFRDFVVNHDYRQRPILTAYVETDPTNPDNRRERPAWLIELGNEAQRLGSESAEAAAQWERC